MSEALNGTQNSTAEPVNANQVMSGPNGGVATSFPKNVCRNDIRRRREAYIYFLGAADGGPIKIGCAVSAPHRIAQLDAKLPFETEMLAVAEGSRAIEAMLHRHFAPHRVRGEWFKRVPELLDLIERARAGAPWPAYVTDHLCENAPIKRVVANKGKPLVRVVEVAPFHPGNYKRNPNLEMIRRAVLDGQNYTEIAKQVGVSRERIRQLAERLGVLGVRSRGADIARKQMNQEERNAKRLLKAQRDAEILRLIVDLPTTRIAALLGISQGCVLQVCHRYGVFPKRKGRKFKFFKYDDAEIERLRKLGLDWEAIAQEIGAPSTMALRAHCYYHANKKKHQPPIVAHDMGPHAAGLDDDGYRPVRP